MNIQNKIRKRKAIIGIIGLGYVGLPLFVNFIKSNFKVYGFDIDKKKIKSLNQGISYINHVDFNFINNQDNNSYNLTTDFSKIKDVDIIILCLPTPLNKKKVPDLSYIKNTISLIKNYLSENQVISLESTTYPGCTRELIYKPLKDKFDVGSNFNIIYSPEREDPGNNQFRLKEIPKVISGYSENCLQIAKLIYGSIFEKVVPVKNLETAELTKLYENIFRSVNISLVNELKFFTYRIGVDVNEIIKAASTKPFGFMPFSPGPGLGGHCIPIDPIYLSWKAKSIGVSTDFINTSYKVNLKTTKRVFKIVNNYINSLKHKKSILIIGIAYKKNVDDIRESPALKLIENFYKNKYDIAYHDPFIKKFPQNRNYYINLKSKALTSGLIKKYKYTLICTDHDKIDYEIIYKYSTKIFDSRNIFSFFDDKIIQV